MLRVADFNGPLTSEVLSAVTLVTAAHQTPIFAMIQGAGRMRPIKNEEPKWYTSALGARRTQINNVADDYTAGTTAIVVDDGSLFSPNDTVICEATGEQLLVVSISTNTLTVRRGAGAHADSVADDAYLQIISNASGEGSVSPEPRQTGLVENSNVIQTFRRSAAVSGRMERVGTDTDYEYSRQKADKFAQFLQERERALLFGSKSTNLTDVNGYKTTTMGGLLKFVTTNVTLAMGAIDKDDLRDGLADAYQHGQNVKYGYAGPTALSVIHSLYERDRRILNSVGGVGLQITEIAVPWGVLRLAPHNALTGGYAGDIVVVDHNEIEWGYTENPKSDGKHIRPTGMDAWYDIAQDDGADSRKGEFFGEGTGLYGNEQAYCWLRGITGAAAA